MTSQATNPWPPALAGATLENMETPSVPVPCGHVAHFGDPAAEYEALAQAWGVADFSRRTQIEVRGNDRTSFIHNLCTAHIKKLQPGQGAEAFITNVQGRTLGLVYVFCIPDALVLETVPGQAAALLPHLDRYHIIEDVELTDRSETWGELLVAGPQAAVRLAELTGTTPPAEYLAHHEATLAGVAVSLRNTAIVQGGAWLLSMAREHLPTVWQALTEAGAKPVGNQAVEVARVEAGTPWYGVDLTDRNLPQELDRNDLAISFNKGCYLGQETVARLDALGHVNQTLCGLRFDGAELPPAGTEIQIDGKLAARITSAVHSPKLGAPLALAYVRRGRNTVGNAFPTPYGTATVMRLPVSE